MHGLRRPGDLGAELQRLAHTQRRSDCVTYRSLHCALHFRCSLGAVCFGMLGDDVKDTDGYTWCLTVGLATLANSIFNCFIICK